MDNPPVELRPGPSPDGSPGLLLLVVHPDERVRRHVLAAAPSQLLALAVERPEDLRLPAEGATACGALVVALDPARTPALAVRDRLPAGLPVHLLSVSDLQLDGPDPAVDSTLPRRRLTRTSLVRHLRTVGVLERPTTSEPRRPHLSVVEAVS